jgi:hypothetical protein
MGNPSWYPDFIDKEPREFTIADWGLAYRKFVERMKFLELWPFKTEEERRDAWEDWMAITVYLVGL